MDRMVDANPTTIIEVSTKKGKNGLSTQVANKVFEAYKVEFEDRKKEEGCYIAKHPTTGEVIRRATNTDCVKAVIESWFTFTFNR